MPVLPKVLSLHCVYTKAIVYSFKMVCWSSAQALCSAGLTGWEGEVERARVREGWATNQGAKSREKSESHPKVLKAAAE